jgi:hypothetical protein
MYAYLAQIIAEALLHEGACPFVQRTTRRAQHFTNERRNASRLCPISGETLEGRLPFLAAAFALTTGRVLAARALALEDPVVHRA